MSEIDYEYHELGWQYFLVIGAAGVALGILIVGACLWLLLRKRP